MQLAVLGLNHNTATVNVRERFAVKKENLEELYGKIMSDGRVFEACVVSTCNRVEYYVVTEASFCDKSHVLDILSTHCGLDTAELNKYTYFKSGREAVKHIFAVASGLDSLVLGEPQIFGQIKSALESSREYGGFGGFLNRLSEYTLKTAKRVRTFTGISENPVSVSYAAVELSKKIFNNLEEAGALIIGAGEMCELAARHLVGSGIGSVTVTNRTLEKAEKLAGEFGGKAISFDEFPERLSEADIIISSTGAPGYVVTGDMMKSAMAKRRHRPMFFIDIAVPRDIDPAGTDVENVYVYDIDDLKSVVEANKKEREKEAKKGWEIVCAYSDKFDECMESLKITPVIKQLRSSFDEAGREELQKFCDKNKVTDPDEIARLNHLVVSTLNKILHTPFTNLKHHAADGGKYSIGDVIDLIFLKK